MNGEDFTKGEFQGKVLEKLDNIENWLRNIDKEKVNRSEFVPVKSIVYGLVSLILMTVIGALLAQVVKAVEIILK